MKSMNFLDTEIAPLGMGCWPIGGEMYSSDGTSLAYANSNDHESLRTVQAALANGITVFDTAAAYGAGHSERLLGAALKKSSNALIVTKIGIPIDEKTKSLNFGDFTAQQVIPAIDDSLVRLDRDSVDVVLLHINSLPVEKSEPIFDELETARTLGKTRAYGWSTDFSDRVTSMANRPGFLMIEHAMNVLLDAPRLQQTANSNGLHKLIRSPLAMGLLSGKYSAQSPLPADDIRSRNENWLQYYIDSRPNPAFLKRFDAIRELLQVGGRTPVQGALGWLWAKSPDNIPIPGARTVAQIEELAMALEIGALPDDVMNEIESLIERDQVFDREDRER